MFPWKKKIDNFTEANAAKKSARVNAYHTGRMIYEKYLSSHRELLIENGGPTDVARREANNSQDLAQAERLFNESIVGANENKVFLDSATAYQQLGQLYFYQGRFEESKSSLKKSLEILSSLGNLDATHKTIQSDTHYFLGLTLIDMNDFKEAEKELNISTAIDKSLGNMNNLEYGRLAMERLENKKKIKNKS